MYFRHPSASPFPFSRFARLAVIAVLALAPVRLPAQNETGSLSATLEGIATSAILFPGQDTTASLAVRVEPGTADFWDTVQIRLRATAEDGTTELTSFPASFEIEQDGSRRTVSLAPNQWVYASYLGLGTRASSCTVVIRHAGTRAGTIRIAFEVESPRAASTSTASVLVRCSDLSLIDIGDPTLPGDDVSVEAGDTAWLRQFQDGDRALPFMPRLVAEIVGIPAAWRVDWTLSSRYQRRGNRDALRFPGEGVISLPGDQSWKAFGTYHGQFFGGDATLTYQVFDAAGELAHQGERRFKILCQNPRDSGAQAYIEGKQGKFWFAWAISQHESRQNRLVFNQFNNGGSVANEPNFGPPDGWGIFQIDSARGAEVTTQEVWDWRTNVEAGFDELRTAERDTRNYFEAIARNYPREFEPPPATYTPPGCKTVLTGEEASIMQCYNGASIVIRLRNVYGTYSYYRSCWRFDPGAASGKRWKFVPNRNNYVYKVIKHEYEASMPVEE